MADVSTLNEGLKKLIPSIDTKGKADAVKSSGLIESLQNFANNLKSYSSKSTSDSKENNRSGRTSRTVRDNERDAQQTLLGALDLEQPDEEEIFQKNRQMAQGQIDLINQERDRLIEGDLKEGAKLQKRGRALNVGAGLGGSDFATANASEIDEGINKVVESRKAEASAKVSALLGDVAFRSSEQFRQERQTFLDSAKDRLDLITQFNENMRKEAQSNITALVANGVTLDTLRDTEPDTYEQLLEDLGGSEELLKATFVNSVPEDKVLYEENINGQYVQVFQDPVTGEISKQAIDLGIPAGLKKYGTTASGQIIFGPENLTDTSELTLYGQPKDTSGKNDDIFKFDTDGKESLISDGYSSSDITNLQSDINKYGLDVALEGMDEEEQKKIRGAVKKESTDQETLTRENVATFLGIDNPEDDSNGADAKGGFFGFGAKDATPSSKETVDQTMSFIESYRALGYKDDKIRDILLKEIQKQSEDEED